MAQHRSPPRGLGVFLADFSTLVQLALQRDLLWHYASARRDLLWKSVIYLTREGRMSFKRFAGFHVSSFSIFRRSMMQHDELPLADAIDDACWEEITS